MAKKKKAAAKKPVQKKAAPKAKSAKKAPAMKAKPAAKSAKPAGKKAPAKPAAKPKAAAKPMKAAAKAGKPAAKPSKLKQAAKAVAKVAGKAAAAVKAVARKPPVRKPAPAPVQSPVDDGWEAAQSFARPGSNGEHDIALNIVEAMALTALADGSVEATEQVMIARLAAQPALASIQDLAAPIRRALDRFRQVGAQQAMLEAVAPISDPLDRERAFLACVAVATADGTVKASEIEVLEVLKQAFDYSSEDVMRLVGA